MKIRNFHEAFFIHINSKIMKIKYSILLIFLLFNSCKKEDELPKFNTWGTLSVFYNGDNNYFKNQISGYKLNVCDNQIIGISMKRYNKSNPYFATDSFIWGDIPTRKGFYKIKDLGQRLSCSEVPNTVEVGTYYNINEGDTGIQQYTVLNTSKENNYLQIDEYNKETKEIKGRFQVTFVLKYLPKYRKSDPDTVRFTNGVFHTKVLD
jgi:hypothetical protein